MHGQTAVFRALADPTRRAIFERLTRGESSVGEICGHFAVSQPAVSQHLGALRRAGLVRTRREGRRAFYRAEPKGLAPLVKWLAHYQVFWSERLKNLAAVVEEMDE